MLEGFLERRVRVTAYLVLAASVIVLAWWMMSEPADASGCPPRNYRTEANLSNAPLNCRDWIVDVGVGEFMDRADLIANRDLYQHSNVGFSRNFLWYARQTTITVSDHSTYWAYCSYTYNPVGSCDPNRIAYDEVLDVFGYDFGLRSVRLSVWEHDGAWISRVCGNFERDRRTTPVPSITGVKFHDLDRDGIRDANEPGLSGFRFRLVRETSRYSEGDQLAGRVGYEVVSGADGRFTFRLTEGRQLGPGRYRVEELTKSGWVPTTAISKPVTVAPGVGSKTYDIGDFGNARTDVDVSKTMEVVSAPSTTSVGQPFDIVVASTITNHGPARFVRLEELLTVSAPGDCQAIVVPDRQEFELDAGESIVVESTVTLTCTRVSDHLIGIENRINVLSDGVVDRDESNDADTVTVHVEIEGESDVSIGVLLDCVAQTLVDSTFGCRGTATVTNDGPYGPETVEAAVALRIPDDCSAELVGDARFESTLGLGESASFDTGWDVVCEDRSFHEIELSGTVNTTDRHLTDPDPSNNISAYDDVVEIFESVDLSVFTMTARCDISGDFCIANVPYANDGPADDVAVLVSAVLIGGADCTLSPSRTQVVEAVLAAGESAEAIFAWSIDCPDGAVESFVVEATIANDPFSDPHAVDGDSVSASTGPIDIKPNSDPNSITTGRNGVVAVAVLGSAAFDPIASIDPESVTFGPTGYEAEAVRCNDGEDVNGDGYLDLVCHFYNQDTGFTPDDEYGYLRATLTDGSAFVGADAVRVLDRGSEVGNDWHDRANERSDENTPPDNSDRGNGKRTGQGS